MLDFVQKYLCFGTNPRQRSASASTIEKNKPGERYICRACQKDFLSQDLYELHQKNHCPNDGSTSGLTDLSSKKDANRKVSSNDISLDIKTRENTIEAKNPTDQGKKDRSQIYMNGGDKPASSGSSSSVKGGTSQHNLEKRRGSLGSAPTKGSEAQSEKKPPLKIDDETQSESSIGTDPVEALVNELQGMTKDKRRQEEVKFIEENIQKKAGPKYIVSEKWINKYIEYLNAQSKYPPGLITNEEVNRQALAKNQTLTIYTVNETVWKFMHKLYGGGPEILHSNLAYSRSASDSASEPQTADTMSQSQANESLRTSLAESRSSKKKVNLYLRPMGMENDSFYCYMNACLQGLLSIGEFAQYTLEERYKEMEHKKNQKSWKALNEVVLSHGKRAPYCTPKAIRKIAMNIFDPDEQHDAHEFLRFLLSGMQDEVNLSRPKKEIEFKESEAAWAFYKKYNVSLVDELFAGQLINQVACCACKHVSTTFDPFLDLSLPVTVGKTQTLDDCLEAFQKEEEIKDSYTCEKCKSNSKVIKRMVVNKFPKYLVVHLKRFQLYPKKKKITEPVTFSLDNWTIKKSHDKEVQSYSLIANIVHRGSFDSGHYVCYAKRGDDWLLCDDESIKIVSAKEVSCKEAYVLIYERKN